MRRLVVWGAGELGGRVAKDWCAGGGRALAATRSATRHTDLGSAGIDVCLGSPVSRLDPSDVLLLALPGTSAQAAAVAELSGVEPPHRAVLVSSTGFHAGAVGRVDARTPVGASARADAITRCEMAFAEWAGDRGVVVRCGGLHAAGRGPLAALRARAEEVGDAAVPVGGPPERTLALVHYDDASRAVGAALVHAAPAPLYLCVTPPCPTRAEFYAEACATLGLPPPEFGAATTCAPADYDVALLRRDLLPVPSRPDWRDAARS